MTRGPRTAPGRAAAPAFVAALAALVAAPPPALAIGGAEKGGYSVEADGSGRLTCAFLHYPDVPGFFPAGDGGLASAVLRLLVSGRLGSHASYESNLFASFSLLPGSLLGGAFATAGTTATPYRTRYLSWEYWRSGSVAGEIGVDRLAVGLELDRVSLEIGRFPVNWSVTRLFAPNDFFAPFTPMAIDTEFKPGVDAARIAVTTGPLSSIEAAGVLGHGADGAPGWGRSAVLFRMAAVLWKLEWALLGGKVAERWIAGASIQGEIGPVGLHGEGHVGFPDLRGDWTVDDLDGDGRWQDGLHARLAAGLDLAIAWHNLAIGAEYMFLSDGASRTAAYAGRAARFFPDDQHLLGRHYVGLAAGLDLVPILRLDAMALVNARDGSGAAVAMLRCSISDESDAVLGMIAPWGDPPSIGSTPYFPGVSLESEFGTMPLMVFLDARFYF